MAESVGISDSETEIDDAVSVVDDCGIPKEFVHPVRLLG
jgi:hypothetical protein